MVDGHNIVKKRINEAIRNTHRYEYGTSARGSSCLRWLPLNFFISQYVVSGMLKLGTISRQRRAILTRCLLNDELENPISDKFHYFNLDLSTTRNIDWRELEFKIYSHLYTLIDSSDWIPGSSEEGRKLAWQLKLWKESVVSLKNRRSNIIQH